MNLNDVIGNELTVERPIFLVNFDRLQQYTLHKVCHALSRTGRRRSENKNPRHKNLMTFTKNTTFQKMNFFSQEVTQWYRIW